VLALTRVQGLFEEDPPYLFLYPELGHAEHLLPPDPMPSAASTSGAATAAAAAGKSGSGLKSVHFAGELPRIQGSFLEEAFILLPASRVRQIEAKTEDTQYDNDDDDDGYPFGQDGEVHDTQDDEGGEKVAQAKACLKEKRRQWADLNAFLKREIEESFPVRRWVPARNLTREILRCKEICVTPDRRQVFVHARPKQRFSIIDFLSLATRKSGPGEQESDKVRAYAPLVNILLKNNVPETYFINRLLLSAAAGAAGRRQNRQRPRAFRGRRLGRSRWSRRGRSSFASRSRGRPFNRRGRPPAAVRQQQEWQPHPGYRPAGPVWSAPVPAPGFGYGGGYGGGYGYGYGGSGHDPADMYRV